MQSKSLAIPLATIPLFVLPSHVRAAESPLPATKPISLAGTWQFGLPEKNKPLTLPATLSEKIHLPGTMDDAGFGPKNQAQPDLSGPYRLYNYAGPAWYRREIDIPKSWQGKAVSLFLERCRWTTTVYLDGQKIDSQDSLISPHVYNLGAKLTPGRHQLTLCVDNTVKIWLGTFVSALYGGTPGNMNGVVGRIELSAKPLINIANVQVYPNIDKMTARVLVKIGNASGRPGQGNVQIGTNTVAATWGVDGGQVETEVDMKGARLWDEFSSHMSQISVQVGDDSRTVRFGMRKLAIQGTQFTLNGRPLFLRGTLECSIWPLTGYPPTDEKAWRRIYKIVKSHGLNFMRFHSWTPPEVADEAGMLLQVEAPQANVGVEDPVRNAFTLAEMRRIMDTYGNHPSFCLMNIGNEYGGDPEIISRHVQTMIDHDSRHLYSCATWDTNAFNRQWTETATGRGVEGPATNRDLKDVVASEPRPIIGHEIGQWMYYPDQRTAKKYTGVMRLKNFDIVYDDLRKKRQIELAPKYIEASGKLATLMYKEEIEVLLRTRGYGGFSLLDLHDYPTQGTALVGPLDEFWDSKGFVTPQEFKRYSGPVVPLVRMSKRTFTSGEQFNATIDVAQYGPSDMTGVRATWDIRDPQGKVVASGTASPKTLPTGTVTEIGAINASLAAFKGPGKFKVTVSIPHTSYSNSWDIWVYPAKTQPITSAPNVLMKSEWDESAKTALLEGKTVFISSLKLPQSRDRSLPGSMAPVFWSPVWFATQTPNTMSILCDPGHPAFAEFPTEMHSNWQWWDLLSHSKSVVLDDAPDGFKPIVQVIDNFARNRRLGNLFEARVGSGKLLFCSMDLNGDLSQRPAARQLLASLTHYAASPKFNPQTTLTLEKVEQWLLPRPNQLQVMGAKVISTDSESSAFPASNILRNDDSFWHTKWEPQPDAMPHEVVVDMGKEVSIQGVTCLARQDGSSNGRIAECEVYCTDDLNNWGQPVAKTKLANSEDVQTIRFEKTARGRYLKLKILSEQQGNSFASLGELDVLLADS